jgi:hypothetical protein
MAKKEEVVEEKTITKKIVKGKSPKKNKKTITRKKRNPSQKKSYSPKKPETNKEVERVLIENFTSLQRVMTNLSEQFNTLSGRIDKLLNLFEDSAKELVKKDIGLDREKEMNLKVISKMEELLEQNKIIAKSITMLFEQELIKREPMKKTIKKEELIPPRPIKETTKGYSASTRGGEEEIKSPNRRQEELGMKNPFVKEEGEEDEWEPDFDIPK